MVIPLLANQDLTPMLDEESKRQSSRFTGGPWPLSTFLVVVYSLSHVFKRSQACDCTIQHRRQILIG